MKKNLLLLASFAMAMSAAAQVEAVWFEKPASFAETGKTTVEAGTVIATGEAGTLKLAYTDDWGVSSIDANGYNSVKVNGVDLGRVPSGAVGNSNPQGWSTTTAATSGAVFQLDVKKDGYVTILSKYSTNKNYWVFEGVAGEGEACMAYAFGMQVAAGSVFANDRLDFWLPADKDGYLNLEAADIDKYVNGTSIKWPEKVVLGDEATDVKISGFGAIMFPVFAEAGTYLFGGQGTKMTSNGFIFTETAPVVTIYGEGGETEVPEITFSFDPNASAIDTIITDAVADENAPMYNVMGQRVNEDYKGIVIKNGKKYVNF
ncbi:MAG: hypothetical protein K2M71_09700 [Duncaniella sp.]|nr:hypothetical protein [Duncaniella sp.]MDE7475888.1 hypothetical protein [Duncaniella sp.]